MTAPGAIEVTDGVAKVNRSGSEDAAQKLKTTKEGRAAAKAITALIKASAPSGAARDLRAAELKALHLTLRHSLSALSGKGTAVNDIVPVSFS